MADDANLTTPVLFLVFNRPEVTKRVFEAIRRARPSRLYVAADGPREDRPGEAEAVERVRRIATDVDWDCEVKTLFRDSNLGCKRAVSSAIDWFFENEEQGIVLEDDCLPTQSFFRFCEEILDHYKYDQRIGQVSGVMRYPETVAGNVSYIFSRFGSIWGWASWRRAWRHYDVDIAPDVYTNIDAILETVTFSAAQKARRREIVERLRSGTLDTWDYQWGLAKYANHMLSVVPCRNLIENVGLDGGTHGTDSSENRRLVRGELSFPLSHSRVVFPSNAHDREFAERLRRRSFFERAASKVNRLTSAVRR